MLIFFYYCYIYNLLKFLILNNVKVVRKEMEVYEVVVK